MLDGLQYVTGDLKVGGGTAGDKQAAAPAAAAASATAVKEARQESVPWNPPLDNYRESPIDLRFLNEKFAGEDGLIQAEGEQFVHAGSGKPSAPLGGQ